MHDFKRTDSAHRFCRAHDAVRNFLRPATARDFVGIEALVAEADLSA